MDLRKEMEELIAELLEYSVEDLIRMKAEWSEEFEKRRMKPKAREFFLNLLELVLAHKEVQQYERSGQDI